MTHPKYRPDIDGLRALAVLAVVCFHAFPNVLKGGFVGVDIFFVISGFLISSILIKSLENGTFSFKEFYSRRVLRIFPALIIVLSTCYFIGWLALLPKEFQQLGKHIVGGVSFVSNLFLWQEAGYFDNLSETKPLLHLWSLGVEEQYYIIWPCLLLLAWKLRINMLKIIAFIIAISFAGSLYTIHVDKVQAFYSPLSRFWELLLGGLLAYLQLHKIHAGQCFKLCSNSLLSSFTAHRLPTLNPALTRNGLSILGALLIFFAVVYVDKNKLFPGWWALLPTLGAYLIISAGPLAVFNRLILSSRPMVWVGLISYPLYLWHWPLLSFATIIEVKTPSIGIRATAVALAFVLAWLTYIFIERPIRLGSRSLTKISILVLLMMLLATLGGVAYMKANVRSSALTKDMLEQIAKLNFGLHYAKWSTCPNTANTWSCKILDPHKPAEIALIGDSHSVHLASGLAELDIIKKHNIISRNRDACMPVFKLKLDGLVHYQCKNDNIDKALTEAIESESIKVIMLSGHAIWKIQKFNIEKPWEGGASEQAKENADILEIALYKTLSPLVASGKKIIFFVDTPELDFDPTDCVMIRPLYFKNHVKKEPCGIARWVFNQRNVQYHRVIESAKKAFPAVKFINVYDYLCDDAYCYALKDETLLYMDNNHLSADGSRYVFKKMVDELKF